MVDLYNHKEGNLDVLRGFETNEALRKKAACLDMDPGTECEQFTGRMNEIPDEEQYVTGEGNADVLCPGDRWVSIARNVCVGAAKQNMLEKTLGTYVVTSGRIINYLLYDQIHAEIAQGNVRLDGNPTFSYPDPKHVTCAQSGWVKPRGVLDNLKTELPAESVLVIWNEEKDNHEPTGRNMVDIYLNRCLIGAGYHVNDEETIKKIMEQKAALACWNDSDKEACKELSIRALSGIRIEGRSYLVFHPRKDTDGRLGFVKGVSEFKIVNEFTGRSSDKFEVNTCERYGAVNEWWEEIYQELAVKTTEAVLKSGFINEPEKITLMLKGFPTYEDFQTFIDRFKDLQFAGDITRKTYDPNVSIFEFIYPLDVESITVQISQYDHYKIDPSPGSENAAVQIEKVKGKTIAVKFVPGGKKYPEAVDCMNSW